MFGSSKGAIRSSFFTVGLDMFWAVQHGLQLEPKGLSFSERDTVKNYLKSGKSLKSGLSRTFSQKSGLEVDEYAEREETPPSLESPKEDDDAQRKTDTTSQHSTYHFSESIHPLR